MQVGSPLCVRSSVIHYARTIDFRSKFLRFCISMLGIIDDEYGSLALGNRAQVNREG